jgi:hypothetical protein
LIEEARPIVNWDSIRDHLRQEDHNRKSQESSGSNPLRYLDDDEITKLRTLYQKYTPLIKLLFVAITALQLLWDVMLVCTMLYYHRMIEKVAGGIFAICTWFFTYRAWYPSKLVQPEQAGKGNFNYQSKASAAPSIVRRSSLLQNRASTSDTAPMFMGRPIYAQSSQKRDDLNLENSVPPQGQGKYDFQPPTQKFTI